MNYVYLAIYAHVCMCVYVRKYVIYFEYTKNIAHTESAVRALDGPDGVSFRLHGRVAYCYAEIKHDIPN